MQTVKQLGEGREKADTHFRQYVPHGYLCHRCCGEIQGIGGQIRHRSRYLEIEITESAYAEDDDKMQRVLEDLRRAGFPVFMDGLEAVTPHLTC